MYGGGNIQSCTYAETELLSNRKPKLVIKNQKNGHKNPNNSHNYHDEIMVK